MKTVLIPGWSTGENSFGVGKAYLHYFSSFGTRIIIGTPMDSIIEGVDLVVLPGGMDTLSSNYNEPPSYYNTNADPFKEYFMKKNLPEYIKRNTPIFGICLGHQMLQVAFGGSLVQECFHPYSESRDELKHDVTFAPGTTNIQQWADITKKTFKVNSMHHQGIAVEDLCSEFKPIVISNLSTEPYNIVEAMVHRDKPIASVQYHPEETFDRLAGYLIQDLLSKSSKKVKENTAQEVV